MANNFKDECKKMAYKNRLGKIEFGDIFISNSDNLSTLEINDSCYSNGTILGTANNKTIKFTTMDNYDMSDEQIKALIGVKYDDKTKEYIIMGNYTISTETNDRTAKTGQFEGYDDFYKLDKEYICGIEDLDNATVLDFYIDLCNQLGLTPNSLEFINSDIIVGGNPFTNKEKCRFVLQQIGQVFCKFATIDWESNYIDLIWFDEEYADTIDKTNYSTLEKNQVYGPVNCLVIGESAIEGENVTRQDETSIETNGETQIRINDNYFLNTEALRTQAIDNIWNILKGFTYIDCKITSYTGMPYLKRGNKIKVQDDEGTYFDTYVLNHTFTFDGTFKSIIESPSLTKTETQIKNTQSISSYFRKVERTVNKIDGQITDVVEQVNEDGEKITNITQTVSDLNTTVEDNKYYIDEYGNKVLISNAVYNLQQSTEGAVSTISNTGGNNLIMNSIGMFGQDYWEGVAEPFTNTDVQRATGQKSCWLLNKGIFKQQISPIKNGIYTISLLYKKLKILSNTSIKIDDVKYDLEAENDELKVYYEDELLLYNEEEIYAMNEEEDSSQYLPFSKTIEVKDNTLTIEFESNANSTCYICNLMCNPGNVAQPFSNNSNETTTETVKIGQGIEITSNTMNTKFTANADGIRIKNASSNEVVDEFTDKGMITNDFESKGTSQVSGVLVMKVNGHAWLTGIEE